MAAISLSADGRKLIINNQKPVINKEYLKYKEKKMKMNKDGKADCKDNLSFDSEDEMEYKQSDGG